MDKFDTPDSTFDVLSSAKFHVDCCLLLTFLELCARNHKYYHYYQNHVMCACELTVFDVKHFMQGV